MSDEIKYFDPRALGSITSGVLLLDDFSKVHEAIEWVMGYPVWTHELPSIRDKATAEVKAQYDGMPLGEVADWKKTADFLLEKYGWSIPLKRGSDVRTADPVSTLMDVMQGRTQ